MTAYRVRLSDLIRRIRDDANADLEIRDVTERLTCCDSDDERDALVRRWLTVRGAA